MNKPHPATRLTWIGHSTVLIETAGRRLITDPVLGSGLGPIRRRAEQIRHEIGPVDAVLISHLHHDHLDVGSLRSLNRDATIIVPAGAGRLVKRRFTSVVEVECGDRVAIGDVNVHATPARHSGSRLPFGPHARALGYVIDGDHRLYFAGDTDIFSGMELIVPGLDVAILPIGGWGPTLRGGHMDPARAASALTLLRPRYALAVHWGTLWPIGLRRFRKDRFEAPLRQFVDEASNQAPGVRVFRLDPGGRVNIDGSPARSGRSGRSARCRQRVIRSGAPPG
jgi:L-ascorbate metabolism protein UlaG (beta-lactamase superfamily)